MTPRAAASTERLARLAVWTAAALVCTHVAIWVAEAARNHRGLGAVLSNWDGQYYNQIARTGYSGRLYAFFPLYPQTVGWLARHLGLVEAVQWVGAALSLACFTGFVALLALALRSGARWRGVVPATSTGWLVFMLSPASYVFHYHGTEATFLLLSFAAFVAARRDRWVLAAALAGLAALTRTQGLLVCGAIALESIRGAGDVPARLRRFAASASISGALAAIYPIWLQVHTGDALAFQHVHGMWRQAHGVSGALATLWFGNPWQDRGLFSILHHVFFFVLLVAAALLLWREPRERPLALYVAASTVVVTFQGELANMYRFGAVLFPALFVIGDRLHELPRPARAGLVAAALVFNLCWAWKYAAGYWAG